jgi:hypothetical protein
VKNEELGILEGRIPFNFAEHVASIYLVEWLGGSMPV